MPSREVPHGGAGTRDGELTWVVTTEVFIVQ